LSYAPKGKLPAGVCLIIIGTEGTLPGTAAPAGVGALEKQGPAGKLSTAPAGADRKATDAAKENATINGRTLPKPLNAPPTPKPIAAVPPQKAALRMRRHIPPPRRRPILLQPRHVRRRNPLRRPIRIIPRRSRRSDRRLRSAGFMRARIDSMTKMVSAAVFAVTVVASVMWDLRSGRHACSPGRRRRRRCGCIGHGGGGSRACGVVLGRSRYCTYRLLAARRDREQFRVAFVDQIAEQPIVKAELPALVDLIITRPMASAGVIAAQATAAKLGLRKMTGRGRRRV